MVALPLFALTHGPCSAAATTTNSHPILYHRQRGSGGFALAPHSCPATARLEASTLLLCNEQQLLSLTPSTS